MGFATCLSLFVEATKRRGELAMYVMPKALESAWSIARRRAWVPFSASLFLPVSSASDRRWHVARLTRLRLCAQFPAERCSSRLQPCPWSCPPISTSRRCCPAWSAPLSTSSPVWTEGGASEDEARSNVHDEWRANERTSFNAGRMHQLPKCHQSSECKGHTPVCAGDGKLSALRCFWLSYASRRRFRRSRHYRLISTQVKLRAAPSWSFSSSWAGRAPAIPLSFLTFSLPERFTDGSLRWISALMSSLLLQMGRCGVTFQSIIVMWMSKRVQELTRGGPRRWRSAFQLGPLRPPQAG